MRLGESNMRHFEDSDLQILGFRFSEMEMSRFGGPTKCCKTQCFEEVAQIVFLDRRWFHSQTTFSPNNSIHLLRMKPT